MTMNTNVLFKHSKNVKIPFIIINRNYNQYKTD